MGKKPLLLAVEHAQIVALNIERFSERQLTKRLYSLVHYAI